jgi:ribonuclease T1
MSLRALLAAFAVALATLAAPSQAQRSDAPAAVAEVAESQLPAEAREALALIRRGGPFPYARDGITFSNREGRLPPKRRGYYREFTVKTPGERTRGARRIIWGAGGEFYYTGDHYNHFQRIKG